MDKQQLFENIKRKKSFLCVGLDTDIKKIPEHLLKEEDPIFAFNKAIIDATADLCIAYKPNLAFYESMGVKGWIAFEKTVWPSLFFCFRAWAIYEYNFIGCAAGCPGLSHGGCHGKISVLSGKPLYGHSGHNGTII